MYKPEIDIDALLEFHRSQFGDSRMEADPAAIAAAEAAAKAATDAADATAKAAADAAAKATEDAKNKAEDVSALPAWAQKVISDTRKEAADNRVAKTAAEKTAADTKAIVDAINAAMNPGAAADPAKLAEQLTAASAKQREAEVRLAVFTAASAVGANPSALLDRNSFLTAVQGLDPVAADFSTKVTAAITAAVAADPTLKTALAAGASTVDHGAGGSGEGGKAKPLSLASAVKDHYSS